MVTTRAIMVLLLQNLILEEANESAAFSPSKPNGGELGSLNQILARHLGIEYIILQIWVSANH